MHWDRKIATMHHSGKQGLTQTFRDMATANRHVECARVAVKVGVAPSHFGKYVEVLGIKQPAFGPAMRRDYRHAAFEGEAQDSRVGEITADNRDSMLAARMGQQRQTGLSHAFPEGNESAVCAIDILAIRQALHHYRSAG